MATSTTPVGAGTPLVDQGIRRVNFFNGRLLTARDLSREQDARHEADARLGQAIGAGVVQGLEVEPSGDPLQRRLSIKAGLGVNRAGQTLCLGADQVLALVPEAEAGAPTTGGFGPCAVLSGGAYVAGDGVYLVTLAPATVSEGKAPVQALEPGNVRCNTDATVEAVQFRLLRVAQELLVEQGLDTNAVGAAAVSKLRSALAYACFGAAGLVAAHRRPGVAPAPGLLEAMRGRGLGDCDVPLAIVYLTASQGLAFVDRWAVRRRVASHPASPDWSAWIGEELDALGDAELGQFQEQLGDIPATSLPGLVAADWFAWLPPAGFLDADGSRQIEPLTFLGPRKPARTVPLAPGDARAVLAQALRRDPVSLAGTGATPRFRVYRIADGGPWLFVREAPNAPHAEEVWIDGERARLPGVHDVQSAIDALSARTCGELTLRPGTDAQALIDDVPSGADLRLCLEAGIYALSRPLRLRHLGHVIVHGGGAASELRCNTDETALLIEGCESVRISDLAVRAGRTGSGKRDLGAGLMGALTVVDTPRVRVERVSARSGHGTALGAGGIVVRQARVDPTDARHRLTSASIVDCHVLVGDRQLGILCVDCVLAVVRQNVVAALNPARVGERGVVVAGVVADDVRIENNVVGDVAQAIAIGLSRKEDERGDALGTRRAVVAGNTVDVALGEGDRHRNRFGVFVGNAQSLLVQANRVTVRQARDVSIEAIRLTGVYGRHVVVRDNHLSAASVGIAFTPLETVLESRNAGLWVFEANLGEGAADPVVRCSESVRRVIREQHNLAV
jgi:nitrous oxidase accessory protein NosD